MKFLLVFIFIAFISACSSEPDLIKQGESLFNKTHLGKNKVIGCIACHSIQANIETTGPTLYGLKNRAENLIPKLSAKEYIKQSITNPDAYIVGGYLPGVMYSDYVNELSELELTALIEYLSSL